MTTDIAALKAAALACDPSKCADEAEHERRLGEFYSECEPEDVLGLIAENERLRGLLAPVADGIQQKRQRWLDNIAAAIRVGLPKSLRQDLDSTYAEIQSSIQHGGGRNLLAEVERLTKFEDWFVRLDQVEQSLAASFKAERDQLKAENEDYKSGQERYEQIIEDLKAEIEALRKALGEISGQVDGNIRCAVRDVVNCRGDVQDIYGYCDNIDEIIEAAMAKEANHG